MNDQIAGWARSTCCRVFGGHMQSVSERLQGSDHEVELDTRFPGFNQRNPLTGYAGGICQLILRPASASSTLAKQAGYVVRTPEQHDDPPMTTNVVKYIYAYERCQHCYAYNHSH
jgi:hypothetical protein